MFYVRVYSGPDGESHFEDVLLNLTLTPSLSDRSLASELMPAMSAHFLRSGLELPSDWHSPRQRSLIVTMMGSWTVETSDGETRRFGPGSVALFEDTTGKGHSNRVEEATTRLVVRLM